MSTKQLLIGAHVSIAGGFNQAIIRGQNIGATCIQIFTKSNRQWYAKPITQDDVAQFLTQQKASSIQMVVAHASYLINLASAKEETAQKSLHALIDELLRCEMLHIPYLVLHPGTYPSIEGRAETLALIAKQINIAFHTVKPKYTTLLLETMAGQGSTVGKTFEELEAIIKHVTLKSHIGVCVDTCHIFAAGYEFYDEKSYKQLWQHFDTIIGLEKLKVFHINDSKKEHNSLVDRHQHIGHGKIKPEAFKLLMQDKKFANIPKILETPKETDEFEDDKRNLATLLQCSKE